MDERHVSIETGTACFTALMQPGMEVVQKLTQIVGVAYSKLEVGKLMQAVGGCVGAHAKKCFFAASISTL